MTVLPEEWSVLEGSTCPPPPVDRSVLRATWVVVRGEGMTAVQKTQTRESERLPNLADYAAMQGSLSELRKINRSNKDLKQTMFRIWVLRNAALLERYCLPVSESDDITAKIKMLQVYLEKVEPDKKPKTKLKVRSKSRK